VLLPIHIAAGGLAIILGAIALSVKKGRTIHRSSGMLFVYAMLVMGTTASILEFRKSGSATSDVASTSIYFVSTAMTTVVRLRPDPNVGPRRAPCGELLQ